MSRIEEKMAALAQRLPEMLGHLQTEEATKNALVMPFISALGYDVFNPQEVVPEFIADVGTKKGEKVDYTIMRDGEIILLIECKKAGADLSKADASQLFRYFSVTQARIALLTNGVQYRFFSDLDEVNKMDSRPFLELDLSDLRPTALRELKKLGKEVFDLDAVLSAASELKYMSEIKKILAAELENPDEEFIRLFFSKANPGARFTQTAREQFGPLVPKAFAQFISEKVSSRLRNALQTADSIEGPSKPEPDETMSGDDEDRADGIVTTEEEMEGFRIVCAIVCREVSLDRVAHRDTKSYMGILLDDNNRKPICRLWFNSKQKYVGVFDADKNEQRIPIDAVSDLYQYTEQLLETVKAYSA